MIELGCVIVVGVVAGSHFGVWPWVACACAVYALMPYRYLAGDR